MDHLLTRLSLDSNRNLPIVKIVAWREDCAPRLSLDTNGGQDCRLTRTGAKTVAWQKRGPRLSLDRETGRQECSLTKGAKTAAWRETGRQDCRSTNTLTKTVAWQRRRYQDCRLINTQWYQDCRLIDKPPKSSRLALERKNLKSRLTLDRQNLESSRLTLNEIHNPEYHPDNLYRNNQITRRGRSAPQLNLYTLP